LSSGLRRCWWCPTRASSSTRCAPTSCTCTRARSPPTRCGPDGVGGLRGGGRGGGGAGSSMRCAPPSPPPPHNTPTPPSPPNPQGNYDAFVKASEEKLKNEAKAAESVALKRAHVQVGGRRAEAEARAAGTCQPRRAVPSRLCVSPAQGRPPTPPPPPSTSPPTPPPPGVHRQVPLQRQARVARAVAHQGARAHGGGGRLSLRRGRPCPLCNAPTVTRPPPASRQPLLPPPTSASTPPPQVKVTERDPEYLFTFPDPGAGAISPPIIGFHDVDFGYPGGRTLFRCAARGRTRGSELALVGFSRPAAARADSLVPTPLPPLDPLPRPCTPTPIPSIPPLHPPPPSPPSIPHPHHPPRQGPQLWARPREPRRHRRPQRRRQVHPAGPHLGVPRAHAGLRHAQPGRAAGGVQPAPRGRHGPRAQPARDHAAGEIGAGWGVPGVGVWPVCSLQGPHCGLDVSRVSGRSRHQTVARAADALRRPTRS
jgi:hypothetical protein